MPPFMNRSLVDKTGSLPRNETFGVNRAVFDWKNASNPKIHSTSGFRALRRESRLLQWGTHSGVSVENASWGVKDRTASVVLIMSSVWRKFAQRRRTARRSTAVADNLPLFASFIHLHVFFRHDQAPSNMSHPATNEWKTFGFFAAVLLCSVDGFVIHRCMYIFLQIFAVFGERLNSQISDQQTASKFLVLRKPMKAHAILPVPVVLAVAKSATEGLFQCRRPTRLTLSIHAVRSIVTSRRSKALQ